VRGTAARKAVAGAATLIAAAGVGAVPAVVGGFGVSEGHAAVAAHAGAVPIPGPWRVKVGSTFTISGHTGSRNRIPFTGPVVLRGRWNGGSWFTFTRTTTDSSGAYRLMITIRRHGVLRLRLLLPGHVVATKTLRVR
jgi:hypothetical protein